MRSSRPLRAAATTALLALVTADAALAGPPWISVEVPANPHHPSTRGALMLVRTYHHSSTLTAPVTARAEGILKGRRVSLALDVAETMTPGVYAVRTRPDGEGTWVVVVTLTAGAESTASAIVALNGEGQVASVEVPSRQTPDGWTVPRAVSQDDIETALRDAVRVADARKGVWSRGGLASLPVGLVALLAIAAAARRRR
jgi:hypothetical protein